MSLKEQIDADIKNAMLNKLKDELRALRSIKSLILIAETEKKAGSGIDRATELKLLAKAVKQRKESAEIYQKEGRTDLASIELAELEVIQRYMPKQLTDKEIRDEIDTIIEEAGTSSLKDMGKIMGMATKKLAGKADGKKIAEIVKEKLS